MKKLTVLMVVLVAGAVRADPGVSLIPSAEFSVRLAEADRTLEAVEGRQRSARTMTVVGIVMMPVTAGSLVMGGILSWCGSNGICDSSRHAEGTALFLTAAVTFAVGLASFIAAAAISPFDQELSAATRAHDRAMLADPPSDDVVLPAVVAPVEDGAAAVAEPTSAVPGSP